jgi:hypothetical protein
MFKNWYNSFDHFFFSQSWSLFIYLSCFHFNLGHCQDTKADTILVRSRKIPVVMSLKASRPIVTTHATFPRSPEESIPLGSFFSPAARPNRRWYATAIRPPRIMDNSAAVSGFALGGEPAQVHMFPIYLSSPVAVRH